MLRANFLIWLNRYSIMEHLLTILCSYRDMVSFSVVFTGGSFCLENVLDNSYSSVWSFSNTRQMPRCNHMALTMSPTRLVIDFTNQVNSKTGRKMENKLHFERKIILHVENMIKSIENLEIAKRMWQTEDQLHTQRLGDCLHKKDKRNLIPAPNERIQRKGAMPRQNYWETFYMVSV